MLAKWVWSSFHPGGQPLSDEEQDAETSKLLKRLDANRGGRITFEEFVQWFERTCTTIERYRRELARKNRHESSNPATPSGSKTPRGGMPKRRNRSESIPTQQDSTRGNSSDQLTASSGSTTPRGGMPKRRNRKAPAPERNNNPDNTTIVDTQSDSSRSDMIIESGDPGSRLVVYRIVQKARRKFDEFDSDQRGFITTSKITVLLEWVWIVFHPGGQPLSDKQKAAQAARLWQMLDTNRDGHVSHKEQQLSFEVFVQWFELTCKGIQIITKVETQPPKRLDGIFAAEPGGDNGDIETGYNTQAVVDIMVRWAQSKFDQLDTEQRGYISTTHMTVLLEWVWTVFHPGGQPLSDQEKDTQEMKLLQVFERQQRRGQITFKDFEQWFKVMCQDLHESRDGNDHEQQSPRKHRGLFSENTASPQVQAIQAKKGCCDKAACEPVGNMSSQLAVENESNEHRQAPDDADAHRNRVRLALGLKPLQDSATNGG